MNNKIYELSEDEFISLIRNSSNKAEVLFKLGYSVEGNSWGYALLTKRMNELHLDGTKFKGKSGFKDKANESLKLENIDKILCENSPHTRAVIRRFILKNNIISYKCAKCGNTGEWQGEPLSLQLDHINGDCTDHRKENLRWLCPNCHSQTETHGSKNTAYASTRATKQYSLTQKLKELIISKYKELGSQQKVSDNLNISRNAVKQVIDEAGLTSKFINQEYVIRYDLNHNEIARYGSINEMCQAVIDAGETRTKLVKTCRNTFNRNRDKVWLNSYWKVIIPSEYKKLIIEKDGNNNV